MKKLIFVLALTLFSLTGAVSGAVTSLTFITDPQAIAVSSVSDKLTVSSGEVVGETSDLLLTSSSPTGEFSSSNTNWQAVTKVTWNSTWSNRSFYYRDSTAGSPTLTATLTTRTSNQTWTATQKLTIGEGGTSGGGSAEESAVSSTSGSNSPSTSAHLSPVELSSGDERSDFSVSAGRRRLAPVGTPLEFRAKISGRPPRSGEIFEVWWSFGDGTLSSGAEVLHSYQLPGTYQVVVNARQGDTRATSRTTVEIVKPSISISSVSSEFIELNNKDRQEVNLGGWHLKTPEKSFTFPSDTIVAGGASLKLASSVSRLGSASLGTLGLYTPDGQVIVVTKPDLTRMVGQLASVVIASPTVAPPAPSPTLTPVAASVSRPAPALSAPASAVNTVTLTTPPKKSWWQRLFSR